jgi:hypothetical protein
MPAARRQPSRSELERIIADLRADNARLLAQQSSPPPAPRIALKLAAHRHNIRPERLRRWAIAGLIDAELVGHQWMVSEQSLAERMRMLNGTVA